MAAQRNVPVDEAAPGRLRLDKWLWAARFYKTRSLATAAVERGQVRIGEETVKPSRAVHTGERISIRRAPFEWQVIVTALEERRGSAADAARLYAETEVSRLARDELVARLKAEASNAPRFPGRPTKRDRRRLEDFLDEP